MKKVKIGACDWALPGGGVYAPRIAAQFGLDALSLNLGFQKNNYPLSETNMQKCYLEDQQKYGIEYVAIAVDDFNNICIFAPKGTPDYDATRTVFRKAVQTAYALGASLIQIPGFGVSSVSDTNGFDGTVDAFQALCDIAGEKGITVALENLMLPGEFKALYEAIQRPNFYAHYDSQNYYWFKGYNQVEVLSDLYKYMCPQIHVKDGRDHMSGALLGQGNSDFEGTINLLQEKEFEGYFLLENYYDQIPLYLEHSDPYELLKKDIDILKNAIKEW